MPTIEQANQNQIREPLEVHCTLMAGSGEALTYTAYSSNYGGYKVAAERTLSATGKGMTILADLQQDGFSLDGTAQLYDYAMLTETYPTKIGLRSNIGTQTAVRVACSTRVATLSIQVSGCDHLTFNGTDYTATQGIVVIPFNTTSGLIYFYPTEEDGRVEVESIIAGTVLNITNDTLISCTVALRSDLSTLDPTLPESEIEIVCWYPDDIAELISNVQDDVPITYYAGYPDDYSPTRKFYLSEQVTWENGALTIKGVDAVHKLDAETPPLFIGQQWNGIWTNAVAGAHKALYNVVEDQLRVAGINLVEKEGAPQYYASSATAGERQKSIIARQSQRDVIANMMNLLHQDYTPGYFSGMSSFWLTYVDAGLPSLTWTKPGVKWTIKEEDCGDIKREVARKFNKIKVPVGQVSDTGFYRTDVGASGECFKNGGVAASYGDYNAEVWFFARWTVNTTGTDREVSATFTGTGYDNQFALPDTFTGNDMDPAVLKLGTYGKRLFDGDGFFSWDDYMATAWNQMVTDGAIESGATSTSLDADGKGYTVNETTCTATRSGLGITGEGSNTVWNGVVYAGRSGSSAQMQILPQKGVESLLNRSNITGGFTWKGNPHMQPRDVVEFVLRDGTKKTITLEEITLQHEGGGLTASITYREGQV